MQQRTERSRNQHPQANNQQPTQGHRQHAEVADLARSTCCTYLTKDHLVEIKRKPVKIRAISTSIIMASATYPWRKPALKMLSSLVKRPNGGEPVMARPPIMSMLPVNGKSLITPETRLIVFVSYFSKTWPLAKKRRDLVIAWLRSCKSAP